jgi:hypothetical protein
VKEEEAVGNRFMFSSSPKGFNQEDATANATANTLGRSLVFAWQM